MNCEHELEISAVLPKYFCITCGKVIKDGKIIYCGFPEWLSNYNPYWQNELRNDVVYGLFLAWEAGIDNFIAQTKRFYEGL